MLCNQRSHQDQQARFPTTLFQPSRHSYLSILEGYSPSFVNRHLPTSYTFKQLHASLHKLKAFYINKIGAREPMLSNENRLLLPLKIGKNFGSLTF